MIRFFILLFCMLLLISCSKKLSQLDQALIFAGENRPELEKVLNHYSKNPSDSLKYKAAVFLIENTPYHNTIKSKKFDLFKKLLPEIIRKDSTSPDEAFGKLETQYGQLGDDFETTNDAKTISFGYLIKNIDQAFFIWEKQPWGKYISFNVFCKEILPYRIGTEALTEWRELFYNQFQPLLDSGLIVQDPVLACKIIYEHIENEKWFFLYNKTTPYIEADVLLNYRFGSCKETGCFALYIMRSLGIAGGIDQIIQNPDKSLKYHFWSYVRDITEKTIEYELNRVC